MCVCIRALVSLWGHCGRTPVLSLGFWGEIRMTFRLRSGANGDCHQVMLVDQSGAWQVWQKAYAFVCMLAGGGCKRGSTSGKVSLPNKHSGSTLVVMTASPRWDDGVMERGWGRKDGWKRKSVAVRKLFQIKQDAKRWMAALYPIKPVDSYFKRWRNQNLPLADCCAMIHAAFLPLEELRDDFWILIA